jgi:hypothetical protein
MITIEKTISKGSVLKLTNYSNDYLFFLLSDAVVYSEHPDFKGTMHDYGNIIEIIKFIGQKDPYSEWFCMKNIEIICEMP